MAAQRAVDSRAELAELVKRRSEIAVCRVHQQYK